MSSFSSPVGRVSFQQSSSLLLGSLQSSQASLLQVQQQISSTQRLNLASDDPVAAVGIQSLNRQIANNGQYKKDLAFAGSFLGTADNTLGQVTGIILTAKSVASSQFGGGSTPDQRTANAGLIDTYMSEILDLANTQYQGQSVFGGSGTQNAFVTASGGYQYIGSNQQQGILTPSGSQIPYTTNGGDIFGGVSSQVVGYKNLTPALSATTRLVDLAGASGKGITTGPINLTVGSTTVSVDLSQAATVNDVVGILNSALTAAGSDATLSLSGGSLVVNGDSTQNISIADQQNGTTAADLGIAVTVPSTGSVTGAPLSPTLTTTTPLSALNNGTPLDPSGFIIKNGSSTATISLAGLHSVGDLLNAINHSGTSVQASINAAGNGINVFNPISGAALTIGENGGNTADQLGIRSFNLTTKLADLNDGLGVTPIANSIGGTTGQITVTQTDGTSFNVQIDGVKTTTQLIAAINNASGNTGVTATLNANGNGYTLTDATGGSGNVSVKAGPNYISNGADLGFGNGNTGNGTLTGAGATVSSGDLTYSTDDFRVTRKDGTSFTVNLTAATTVQDVINQINNAQGNTTAGNQVTASLNATGNGIQLTDASTGSGALTVTALNNSSAAQQLGILKTASSSTPDTINGDDVNPLQPHGLFSSLAMLRDALLNNDDAGIQRASDLLAQDSTRIAGAQGLLGARQQDLTSRSTQNDDNQVQLQSSLSLLADTDMTSAITKYQSLETAYEAALKVASTTDNLSLLDFLK